VKPLTALRVCITLLPAAFVALAAYHWPASRRATLPYDRICWHLAFSGDGTKLAVLDRDAGLNASGQVLVWNASSGDLLQRFDYGSRVFPSRVVFAPDGQTLGLVDAGSMIRWDLGTGRKIAEHDHSKWSHDPNHYGGREILFSPAGRWLWHDVYEGRVYDVETGDVVRDYDERWPDRNREAHGGYVAALVDGKVKTFDVLSGAEVGTFPIAAKPGMMARTALTFGADGTHGVYFGNSGQWTVGNGVTGRQALLKIDAGANLHDCSLSSDHHFVAVSWSNPPANALAALQAWMLDRPLRTNCYDTATGAEIGRPIRGGLMCRFAPDGRTLAVVEEGQRIALLDWPPPSRWARVIFPTAIAATLSLGIGALGTRRRTLGAAAQTNEQPALVRSLDL
jgi:WD40 repeat protein